MAIIKNVEKKIENAFLELYRENEFNNITVKMIAKKAGVSRATFYAYYGGIKELLNEIEDRTIADLREIFKLYCFMDIKNYDYSKPVPMFVDCYKYILKNRNVYLALFGINATGKFRVRYENQLKEFVMEKLYKDGFELENPELISANYAGAVSYKALTWIENPSIATVEQMALLETQINLYNLYKNL